MKPWHWYVGFFIVLLTAYFLYFFNQEDFQKSALPVISHVQDFSFVNQDGERFTEKDVDGKVYVTEYFFTTCKGICPRMNANMRRVYDACHADSSFLILSHTCMPETDSVPVLKNYEDRMLNGNLVKLPDGTFKLTYDSTKQASPATGSNWNFVTGDKRTLYDMARQSYLIDNNKEDTTASLDDQFIHTQFFALVDKQRRVRGIYDGLKENEIQKLLEDIQEMIDEKVQNRSLAN